MTTDQNPPGITIRVYQVEDAPILRQLFYTTIRHINLRDYTEAQVQAWAPDPDPDDMNAWQIRANQMKPFIAEVRMTEIGQQIVGYADLQADGYIGHFFCHKDHQGGGVGGALMRHLFTVGEKQGIDRYYAHVSLTARPFFERFGFQVVTPQQVAVRGEVLTNFVMEKYR